MSKSRIPASDGGSSKPKDNQMADLTENLRGFSASDGGSTKLKDNQMADLMENLRGFSIKQIKVSLAMFAAESQVDFDKQMRVWCSQYRSAADHFYPNVQCLFIVNPTEEEKEEIENFIADEKTAKADRILYDAMVASTSGRAQDLVLARKNRESGRKALMTLAEAFTVDKAGEQTSIIHALLRVKFTTLKAFIEEVDRLCTKLERLDGEISETLLFDALIRSIPQEYEVVTSKYFRGKPENMTVDALFKELRSLEVVRTQREPYGVTTLLVHGHTASSGTMAGAQNGSTPCDHCGRTNHTTEKCNKYSYFREQMRQGNYKMTYQHYPEGGQKRGGGNPTTF